MNLKDSRSKILLSYSQQENSNLHTRSDSHEVSIIGTPQVHLVDMSRPTLYLHNPVVYLQNSDSPRARKRREGARAPADVRICFCSEGEELDDTGDEFYNKLLELKADNRRRLALLLQDQLDDEVNKNQAQISL